MSILRSVIYFLRRDKPSATRAKDAAPSFFDREARDSSENPVETLDAEFWDEWWKKTLASGSCGRFPQFPAFIGQSQLVNTDNVLVSVMVKNGLKTVLCAGNGTSAEPRALAAAGFHVTALDISPVAVRAAEALDIDEGHLGRFCRPELHRPGGRVDFVVGDLFDRTVCPGPFDVIVERRTIQRFAEPERSAALEALSRRLATVGVFLSLCLDDGFPADLGWSYHESGMFHASEEWFREHDWVIWDGAPSSILAGRVAWLIRCGSMKLRPSDKGDEST